MALRLCQPCGAVRCGAVRCGAVRCGAVRCGAARRGAARRGAARLGLLSTEFIVVIIRLVSSYICMFALSLVEVVFRFSQRIYLDVIYCRVILGS